MFVSMPNVPLEGPSVLVVVMVIELLWIGLEMRGMRHCIREVKKKVDITSTAVTVLKDRGRGTLET